MLFLRLVSLKENLIYYIIIEPFVELVESILLFGIACLSASRGPCRHPCSAHTTVILLVLTLLRKNTIERVSAFYRFIHLVSSLTPLHELKMSNSSSFSSSSSSPEATNQPTKRKAQSLDDLLHEFRPIKSVSYTPFQPEQHQPAKALLPSTFPTKPHPYDYFTLFFILDLFQTIITNTNRYANIQRIHVDKEGMRE